GLMMYGQMTAGSWIYIGSQGIVQGTWLTFAEAARKHYSSDLSGKFVLSAGLGGMGGAQPLAVKMNNGVFLGVEIDPVRIQKRLETGYLDRQAENLHDAMKIIEDHLERKAPVTIGLLGNAATVYRELAQKNFFPDM